VQIESQTGGDAQAVRLRLVEAGGRTSQDLGLGRIVGQILVYLYLSAAERSLDQIGEELELSKAAVSIAARQLERLGLIKRSWKKGDRKTYYRTADNIVAALRQGLLVFLGQKIQSLSIELDGAVETLEQKKLAVDVDEADARFVLSRIKRARQLRDKVSGLLDNPILKLFV